MKYGKCNFDSVRGMIKDDDGSLEWKEGTLETARADVEQDSGTCALFFPKDVEGLGHPLNPDVTRSQFEKEPGIYGVCYYKGWSGYVFE